MQTCSERMRSRAFRLVRVLQDPGSNHDWHFPHFRVSPKRSSSTQSIINDGDHVVRDPRLRQSLEERAKNVDVNDLSATLKAHQDYNRIEHSPEETRVERNDRSKGYVYGSSEIIQKHRTESIADAMQKPDIRRVGGKNLTSRDGSMKQTLAPPQIGSARALLSEWDLELEGKVRAARMRRPWVLYLERAHQNASDRLSAEIEAFGNYMRPSLAESGAASLALSTIKDSLDGEYTVELMGSRATGLETPLSDIDLGVHRPEWDVEALDPSKKRTAMHDWLVPLHNRFREDTTNFRKIKLLNSRVPVLSIVHRATDLEIQFQCRQNHDSRKVMTKAYLEDMPSVKPLYHVFRQALLVRNLVGAREGGIGSYPLFVMIITALKFLGKDFKCLDLADQLLYILKFWAELDTTNGAYTADPPRVFNKKKIKDDWFANDKPLDPKVDAQAAIERILEHQASRPYLMCLQDPASAPHDLGQSCYHIKSIQVTFKAIQNQLLHNMRVDTVETAWKLDALVRADYQQFEWRRSKLAYSETHPGQRYMMGSFPKLYRNQDLRIEESKGRKETSLRSEPSKPQPGRASLEALFRKYHKPFSSTYSADEALAYRRANPLAAPKGNDGRRIRSRFL